METFFECLYKHYSDPSRHPLRIAARNAYEREKQYEIWEEIASELGECGASTSDLNYAQSIFWNTVNSMLERELRNKSNPNEIWLREQMAKANQKPLEEWRESLD